MNKKLSGTIYGIFRVEENIKGEMEMKDCFINNYFEWLFHILIEVEGFVWALMGIEHVFVIKLDKK